MVLAVLASVNFSSNEESKAEMQKGFFWQAGNKIINTVVSGLHLISDNTLSKDENKKELVAKKKDNSFTQLWTEFKEKVSSFSFDNIFSKSNEEGLGIGAEIKEKIDELVDETKNIIDNNEEIKPLADF